METQELDSSAVKLLDQIVSEFSDRCRRGENPTLDEYVARHPQLEIPLRDALPALKMLRHLTPGESQRQRMPLTVNVPETIGDYRIVGEIGRGGMGVVFRAVQESLHRDVALKVLPRSSLLDEKGRERFLREAAIAAQLHHTNIVPVFGTGSSNDLHFYAMQFIEGESLDGVVASLRDFEPLLDSAFRFTSAPSADTDRFAVAARRLLEGRLAETVIKLTTATGEMTAAGHVPQDPLRAGCGSSAANALAVGYCACVARVGVQAAAAVAHAHAHCILHRDIKPSNLILDRSGTVWVADFGLARQEDQADLTSTGEVVGTLRYLAPERFRGNVDERADVYALGLTLYELLTFHSAFREKSRQHLIRQILEVEPPPPRKQRSGIPRDLETIVLKAIAKEPDRRYSSAAALGADLQRFLDGRPVTARPLRPLGRMWRWCRRNPVVASLAAALLVALVGGLAVVSWQWRRAENNLTLAIDAQRAAGVNLQEAERQRDRAEQNFLRARRVVDDYLTTVSESTLLDVPTLEPVRADLLSRAKDFYEASLERRGDDSQLQAELAATYIRLSQVTHDLGGDWLPLYEKGVELLEQLGSRGADFGEFRSWREGVNASRSGWLNTDKPPEQLLPITERAVKIWRRLAAENSHIQGFRSDLASLLLFRGMIHLADKRTELATEDFAASYKLRTALVEECPQTDKFRYGLAESLAMIGIMHFQNGELDEAQRFTTKARELFDALAGNNPSATRLAGLQAALYQWTAAIQLRKGKPLDALADFRRAIALQERLAREYPYVPRFQTDLAGSYLQLGRSFFEAKMEDQAKAAYQQCFDFWQQRIADYPDESAYRTAMARALTEFSLRLAGLQQFAEAKQQAQRAIDVLKAETTPDQIALAQAEFRLAVAQENLDELGAAETNYRAALARFNSAQPEHRDVKRLVDRFTALLRRQSRGQEAEELLNAVSKPSGAVPATSSPRR